MSIQILPARLANQIAAGEVVERPASVIKELVENALDAGATRIDIEIEKGGSKLIRIRDNGCGICKEELTLALSRHATSKVSSFDDLENITSLGFRGEALASISSVSRLKLTSKPANQEEAWQAYAEGRDMQVNVIPAAHPKGTTIEVVDLFFNTPARRKFLRTDKTEFYHIDELIKRIALSRFDVQFSLNHNGKTIRHLRRALSESEKDRRISQICGKPFIEVAMRVSCDYEGVSLSGWVAMPAGCRTQGDVQFSYVNGRMMRDKLINHAIRQAYGQLLGVNQYPTYVLFLTVSPRQIDVNVHPAKHEVRFHQARLIHDFIVQALTQAISPATGFEYEMTQEDKPTEVQSAQIDRSVNVNQVNEPAPSSLPQPLGQQSAQSSQVELGKSPFQPSNSYQPSPIKLANGHYHSKQPSKQQLNSYHDALASFSTDIAPAQSSLHTSVIEDKHIKIDDDNHTIESPKAAEFRSCLSVVNGCHVLYQFNAQLFLLDLSQINAKVAATQYQQGFVGQPLLLPVKVALDKSELQWLELKVDLFNQLGFDFACLAKAVVIRKVPAIVRNHDINDVVNSFIGWLKPQVIPELIHCVQWLLSHFEQQKGYDLMTACTLVSQYQKLCNEQQMLANCGVEIDLATAINQLTERQGSTSE